MAPKDDTKNHKPVRAKRHVKIGDIAANAEGSPAPAPAEAAPAPAEAEAAAKEPQTKSLTPSGLTIAFRNEEMPLADVAKISSIMAELAMAGRDDTISNTIKTQLVDESVRQGIVRCTRDKGYQILKLKAMGGEFDGAWLTLYYQLLNKLYARKEQAVTVTVTDANDDAQPPALSAEEHAAFIIITQNIFEELSHRPLGGAAILVNLHDYFRKVWQALSTRISYASSSKTDILEQLKQARIPNQSSTATTAAADAASPSAEVKTQLKVKGFGEIIDRAFPFPRRNVAPLPLQGVYSGQAGGGSVALLDSANNSKKVKAWIETELKGILGMTQMPLTDAGEPTGEFKQRIAIELAKPNMTDDVKEHLHTIASWLKLDPAIVNATEIVNSALFKPIKKGDPTPVIASIDNTGTNGTTYRDSLNRAITYYQSMLLKTNTKTGDPQEHEALRGLFAPPKPAPAYIAPADIHREQAVGGGSGVKSLDRYTNTLGEVFEPKVTDLTIEEAVDVIKKLDQLYNEQQKLVNTDTKQQASITENKASDLMPQPPPGMTWLVSAFEKLKAASADPPFSPVPPNMIKDIRQQLNNIQQTQAVTKAITLLDKTRLETEAALTERTAAVKKLDTKKTELDSKLDTLKKKAADLEQRIRVAQDNSLNSQSQNTSVTNAWGSPVPVQSSGPYMAIIQQLQSELQDVNKSIRITNEELERTKEAHETAKTEEAAVEKVKAVIDEKLKKLTDLKNNPNSDLLDTDADPDLVTMVSSQMKGRALRTDRLGVSKNLPDSSGRGKAMSRTLDIEFKDEYLEDVYEALTDLEYMLGMPSADSGKDSKDSKASAPAQGMQQRHLAKLKQLKEDTRASLSKMDPDAAARNAKNIDSILSGQQTVGGAGEGGLNDADNARLDQERRQEAERNKAKATNVAYIAAARGEFEDRMRDSHKTILNTARRLANEYTQVHFDVIAKRIRRKFMYIMQWRQRFEQHIKYAKEHPDKKDSDPVLQMEIEAYNTMYKEDYDSIDRTIKNIRRQITAYMSEFSVAFDSALHAINKNAFREEQDREDLEEKEITAKNYIATQHQKILSMYNSKFSIMDFIFDAQFIAVYVVKVLHYVILMVSMYFAEKIFSEQYMKKVYGEGADPPDLLQFVGIFMAINAGLLAFMFLIMTLLMYLFKTPSNNFVIDGQLMRKAVTDTGIFIILFMLFSIVLGMTIQKKKYFRYKTEGLRGIRAMKEMMISFAAMLIVIPYFALF